MSNAVSDPPVPAECIVANKAECERVEDLYEAWSPFKEEASVPADAVVPRNSPEDNWGWEGFPETVSSPAAVSVPSPPPITRKTIRIGRLFSPVAMATSCGSGHLLATAFAQQTGRYWTGAVTIHDVTDEPCLSSSFALESTPSCIAFCDDSARSLLVALDDGALVQMELPNGLLAQTRCEHDSPIAALAVSPGRTRAFSCDDSGCVCVWDPMVALANLIRRPSRASEPSDKALSAHPLLERRFVSAGTNTVRLWEEEEEVKSFSLLRTGRSGGLISRVDWKEENCVLVGWTDGTVQAVDIRQCQVPLWSVGGGPHGREILGLCGTPSGAVVSISADNCLRVLKPGTDQAPAEWGLSGGSVWNGRCADKMVTAMVLKAPGGPVFACCRDHTWWRWRDGAEALERLPLAPNEPEDS